MNLRSTIVTLTVLLMGPHFAVAQTRGFANVALGFPELIGGGARLYYDRFGLNVFVGTFPTTSTPLTLMLDGLVQFGVASNTQPYGSWMVRAGVIRMTSSGSYYEDRYVYGNARVGYEFELSSAASLLLDGGVMVELSHKKVELQPEPDQYMSLNLEFPILPSLALSLSYRLW